MKHWLMKTEPETFSIDDLARVNVEPWSGVRNPMARNLMRDQMQINDAVLFYHSSTDPTGVAGLARIVRTGVVDETQFDPDSPYYDPKAQRDAPRWICVDVEYVEKFPAVLPLSALRARKSLANMMLMKWPRLSVQPVEPAAYQTIIKMARSVRPSAANRTTRRT